MKKFIILLAGMALVGLPCLPVFAVEAPPVIQQKPEVLQSRPTPGALPAGTEAPMRPVSVFTAKPGQAAKVGYVDMTRVAADSVPGKAAAAEIKSRAGKIRSQIEAKQKQLEKQRAELETRMQTFTPKQREAKAKEFKKKIEDFQKFVQNAQKDLQTREGALLEKLYKSIEKAAGEYGKANGFTAVTAKKDLLYIEDNVEVTDITNEVVKMVNAEQEKK
jgi:outer membrane protein